MNLNPKLAWWEVVILVLIAALGAFTVPPQATGDEAIADPFRLRALQGMNWPMKETDAKKVYVPRDLDDCFSELEKMLSKTEIERMKRGPEDGIHRYYYEFTEPNDPFAAVFQIDQRLRDLWGLDHGSRLAKWFEARGIDDQEDMADIIVHAFWRHLNAKPIDLDGQVKAHQVRHQVYIPKDLDECYAQLEKLLSKEDIAAMKSGAEKDMVLYHHGLGMWLRNNWGLWKGSRLSKWFNDKGIRHPDDMSGIILDSFWRHLNKKPIKLDEQIKHYQDYWKKHASSGPSANDAGQTNAGKDDELEKKVRE
jgi:hypothetical protein